VLCYAPGGGYPLPSSAIMTAAVAKVAGVKNIYLTSPKIHNATIVAGYLAGASRIFKIGGVQAIAGFAYGTESIPRVDKIVGPGNKFVTAAKKEVYGLVDIDFLAGPSEVLVVADETANPELISADILAQCEHDKDARGYLITTSKELAQNVQKSAIEQLETLSTKEIAKISFEKSIAIIVDNIEEAIELSNLRAPEHLEVMIKDEKKYIDKFTNYGSLFIGNNCAEVFGDYCTGTNHVLPTNKVARYRGGLSVFDFIKIQTYQKISKKYGEELSKIASELAKTEGLMAHKLASDLRGKKNEN
ncbi:histidinol dehydrogenase, partial [bacterium]|nr:histidinol dehydrogenase [bacterium]